MRSGAGGVVGVVAAGAAAGGGEQSDRVNLGGLSGASAASARLLVSPQRKQGCVRDALGLNSLVSPSTSNDPGGLPHLQVRIRIDKQPPSRRPLCKPDILHSRDHFVLRAVHPHDLEG
jgi:hypothetical protein